MKIKQKLNSIVMAGSVLVLFLILVSSTASAKDYISGDIKSDGVAKLEDMKDRVQQLVDHNTLSETTGETWTTLLQTAETALLNDKKIKTISSLNNFINTAKPYLNKNSLSSGSKDKINKLINEANSIISALQ